MSPCFTFVYKIMCTQPFGYENDYKEKCSVAKIQIPYDLTWSCVSNRKNQEEHKAQVHEVLKPNTNEADLVSSN